MERIRKRPKLDTLQNQQRMVAGSWSRRVYFLLLIALVAFGADFVLGSLVFLRADGLVAADRIIVAANYPGRVTQLFTREGATIQRGTVLATLESTEMLRNIADLAFRDAELAARVSDLKVRLVTANSLLPFAERSAVESTQIVERIDTLSAQGLIPASRIDQALATRYENAARFAELRGQVNVIGEQLTVIERERRRATQTLNKLEASYADGRIIAQVDGIVGPRVPVVGQGFEFGEELLQIYGSEPYVLGYLPDSYLFRLKEGDRVTVQSGAFSVQGTVESLLPVTDALPAEFQNLFRPRDRNRLFRIKLEKEQPFATQQKVRITGCFWGRCWNSFTPTEWTRIATDKPKSMAMRHAD